MEQSLQSQGQFTRAQLAAILDLAHSSARCKSTPCTWATNLALSRFCLL